MRDYRKIRAWQRADEFVVHVYRLSKAFPKEESYGLTSQLRRAAMSVPANIVEGSARATKKDYLHFLNIAWASLNEAQYFLHLGHRLGYMDDDAHRDVSKQMQVCFRTLNGLIEAVQGSAAGT
jgi:four helix bundle protein